MIYVGFAVDAVEPAANSSSGGPMRLSPAFVECLQGIPVGWTLACGE